MYRPTVWTDVGKNPWSWLISKSSNNSRLHPVIMQSQQYPQRNCETTPRSFVQEAMRTAKHCLCNHPLSTTKLRDYTQASRSKSYTYRKTLPLQSSPVHNETARLKLGLLR
ncbi:hypothetical protein J6590_088923 [Homalodisca vitripennis]|nr:hypothetical protein J6590_088923 [Homalodisca vitripennis]